MFVLSYTREIIDTLSEGRLIRAAVAVVLRILAVLNLLAALWILIELLKASFKLETQGTIGGLLFSLIFLAGTFVVFQILLYRAQSVQELGDSPFTVIPIFSLLFRTFGETYSAASITLGLGGCLFIWISGTSPLALAPDLGTLLFASGGQTFVDGVLMLGLSVVVSFLILVFFYFLAEIVVVLADIARNVRLLALPAPARAGATVSASPRPEAVRCAQCGSSLAAGEKFCGNCGASALQ